MLTHGLGIALLGLCIALLARITTLFLSGRHDEMYRWTVVFLALVAIAGLAVAVVRRIVASE